MSRDPFPAPLGVLLGRSALLDRLAREHGGGLLVLSGAAGSGKTRVAIEHARTVPGARFVDVVGLTDPVEIARAVGASVGLSLPDAGLLDALARLEPPMMVLDGIEDLPEELAEALGRWVERGRWVLTSRTRLGIGSLEVEVGGLAIEPAIELFEQAVGRVRPGYRVGADREEVAALVEALDRQPLGIELAAGWMDLMEASDVLASLASGRPIAGAQPVERWAHASIGRLDLPDQHALRALLVLAPGFTVEAAAATLGGGRAALSSVRALRRRYLLATDRQDGTLRLRIPRAVRDAAAEAIALPADALGEAEARWAAHFAARGRELVDRVRRGEDLEQSAVELARDEPNLLAVVERAATGAVAVEHGIGAAEALDELSFERFSPERTYGLVSRLLERAGSRQGGVVLMTRAARALVELQRLEEATAVLDDAEAIAAEDANGRGIVKRARAFAAHRRGAFDEAAALAWDAAEEHASQEDRHLTGLALLAAAEAERRRGDLEGAERALARADPLLRASRKLGTTYGMWGMVLLDRGSASEARDRLRGAVRLLDPALSPRDAAMARGCLAYALTLTGELAEAEQVSQEAIERARALGVRLLQAYVVGNQGLLDHLAGRLDAAADRYHDAIAFFVAEGVPAHAAAVRLYLGLARWRQGQHEVARGHLAQAEQDFEATGEHRWWVLSRAALAFVERGPDARAALEELSDDHPDVPRLVALLDGQRPVGEAFSIVPALLGASESAADPTGLRIARDGSWFAAGEEVVRLHRRKSLRRILAELVDRRGGDPIEAHELFEVGWAGDRASPDSARHRTYVALSTLRKLGLEGVIQNWEGGYRLDPDQAIDVTDGGPPER